MIDLDFNPLKLRMIPKGTFFFITLEDSSYKVIDPLNDENTLKIKTIHTEIAEIEISPDGKFVLTGGT